MSDTYLDGLQPADRASMWAAAIGAPVVGQHVVVAEYDTSVVGFAAFGPATAVNSSAQIGELYAINIHPTSWGRGIGRALVRDVAEKLQQIGFSSAVLWVVPGNSRARSLYESESWCADGMSRQDVVLGATVDEIRYARSLKV